MLKVDDLLRVTTVVTHADCADGVASALILKDALGPITNPEVLFVQHGTAALRDMPARPGMLFCDITPPRERWREFFDTGALVLDHHKTQRDIVQPFVKAGRAVYADEHEEPGVSGAMLAYREVWDLLAKHGVSGVRTEVLVRRLALLAGIRDTWQRQDPLWTEACEHAEALKFWPAEELLAGGIARLHEQLPIGKPLWANKQARIAAIIDEALRFTVSGLRVIAFECWRSWGMISDVADRVRDQADVVMCWHYSAEGGAPRLGVEVRSRGGFDSGAFAKHHGGGGHTNASGFTLRMTDGTRASLWPPHKLLYMLLHEYLGAWSEPEHDAQGSNA